MTIFDVKDVTNRDKAIMNYHSTLQGLIAYYFGFTAPSLNVLVYLSSISFPAAGSHFQGK